MNSGNVCVGHHVRHYSTDPKQLSVHIRVNIRPYRRKLSPKLRIGRHSVVGPLS